MRQRIRLDTVSDVQNFVKEASSLAVPVWVTDGCDLRVSAKSLMGVLYSLEFNQLYCECPIDIYRVISQWTVYED